MSAICAICPHACHLDEGQRGLCGARICRDGAVLCERYGALSAVALDPIEKKPLARFMPGAAILSVGGWGCNLRCPFCQNSEISMNINTKDGATVSPEQLVDKALALRSDGNVGIAYTYNEPLIMYEYVRDCAELAHERGLVNVLVTNGYVCEQPLLELMPLIDAMNIDLKAFNEDFYKRVGGSLGPVLRSIELAAAYCHVEVTTLIISGENDSVDEMERLSAWLAEISLDIPLHVSRFFPRYKYADRRPTPVADVRALADIARRKLRHVYTGNC